MAVLKTERLIALASLQAKPLICQSAERLLCEKALGDAARK